MRWTRLDYCLFLLAVLPFLYIGQAYAVPVSCGGCMEINTYMSAPATGVYCGTFKVADCQSCDPSKTNYLCVNQGPTQPRCVPTEDPQQAATVDRCALLCTLNPDGRAEASIIGTAGDFTAFGRVLVCSN
jgi:hypothetical protein